MQQVSPQKPTLQLISIDFNEQQQSKLEQILLFVPPDFPILINYLGDKKAPGAITQAHRHSAQAVVLINNDSKNGRIAWNTLAAHRLSSIQVAISKNSLPSAEFQLRWPLQASQLFSLLETLALLTNSQPKDDRLSMVFAA